MARAHLAIATAFLVAMTVFAAAQGPSYESRGYGGPLYVGPNFQAGGQHSPPVYSPNSSTRKHYRKRRVHRPTTARRQRATEKTETAKSAPEESDVHSENSSLSRASSDTKKAAQQKTTESTTTIEDENSTISRAAVETGTTSQEEKAASAAKDAPKASKTVGCKKYFPTAGMTLSVPCD